MENQLYLPSVRRKLTGGHTPYLLPFIVNPAVRGLIDSQDTFSRGGLSASALPHQFGNRKMHLKPLNLQKDPALFPGTILGLPGCLRGARPTVFFIPHVYMAGHEVSIPHLP